MRTRSVLAMLFVCALVLQVTPAAAQQPSRPQMAASARASTAGTEADLLPDEPVITQHSARINGQNVSYTAEAGWLPIRDDGKVVAKMFYVAYTRDGIQDKSTRPLIFSFNGGPGTASVWMHMGYTGPRRVVYDDDGFALRPPGNLEDNPHSILDAADIVYIDPIATGFSRMVEGEDLHKYHGTLSDIESVGEFIRLFIVRKDRWMSPKFVIGESYGTTRASGLAGYLSSRHQLYLNGVILVSMTNLRTSRMPRRYHISQRRRGITASWPTSCRPCPSRRSWRRSRPLPWATTWVPWCRATAWRTPSGRRWRAGWPATPVSPPST
jgi:carboxypeptidase C (cathepsin A)